MSVSFRDFVTIADAFEEAQLDEGKVWDAIKKKLGFKATDDEVQAEIERLKGANVKDQKAVKQTQQGRDFHARRAAATQHNADRQPRPTSPTVGSLGQPKGAQANDVWQSARGHDRMDDSLEVDLEGMLAEGICEFTVTYTAKTGGGGKKAKMDIKGRDVKEVRRKFADLFFGKKLLSIEPCRTQRSAPKPEPAEEVDEDVGPLGPRTPIGEAVRAKGFLGRNKDGEAYSDEVARRPENAEERAELAATIKRDKAKHQTIRRTPLNKSGYRSPMSRVADPDNKRRTDAKTQVDWKSED